ncbi:hypothetical protein Asp14428_28560 [Actinoplanes sp. NBRC 14428]|nr:hypothetical protein Asp14428_28560 [Actinoplanes sp. NBRC 14428]
MSPAVLRRVALAAAILLVPSVVVGVVAARRSAPAGTAPQPSASRPEEPVTLTAALEPYQIVVFPGKLDPSAAPPADSCRSAMAAMRGLGGVPAIVGRLAVAFRAARTVQLSVDKVSIVTVRREHTPSRPWPPAPRRTARLPGSPPSTSPSRSGPAS